MEQKLHVAVDRVQDPAVVPQGEAWTPAVYLALAGEYESLSLHRNAVEVDELFLRRWPLHPRAPRVRDAAAKARKALRP